MASISIRYARAFADVVTGLHLDGGKVSEELHSVVRLVNENSALAHVWKSPAVPHEQKNKLLDAIAQRAGFETPVRNFLAVLIEHGRIGMLAAIVRQFERELDQRLGFVEADVSSARELSAGERATMEARIGSMTGRKVRANYRIDLELLGGAIAKIGSTVYDGSLRGQLRRIKEQLSAG